MKRFLPLSIVATSALFANVADLRFFYQDYLDFGQNLGRYTAGTKGVLIRERNKNSTTYGDYSKNGVYYDVTMPDFIGSTGDIMNLTFVGGSYAMTAYHVLGFPRFKNYKSPEWEYLFRFQAGSKQTDMAYARYDKFITSGPKVNLLELSINHPLDTDRYTHIWRAGGGRAHYRDESGKVLGMIAFTITGGALKYKGIDAGGKGNFIHDKDLYFSNMVTNRDSGSPFYAWDSYERKWVVIGFASASDDNAFCKTANYDSKVFYSFVNQYTYPVVHLNGGEANWNGKTFSYGTTNFGADKDKDFVFKGGGKLLLATAGEIDQWSGGFYFDENQEYTITSTTGTAKWKGGGVHIGSGTIVHWDIDGRANDGLHKVGEGTLHVIKKNIGWLNLGDGTVILDTQERAFDHYLLISGRGTLQIAKNNPQALSNPDQIFFSRRGGNLDLNGNNIAFKKIKASDIGARIINSSSTKSTLTITNENSDAYLYHGQIGDNIDILSNAVSSSNILAFDGEIYNPSGTLTHKQGGLLFQGHPYIHAYFSNEKPDMNMAAYDNIRQYIGQTPFTAPTSLSQKDWENRIFILKEISTQTGSTFTLGRNAILLADLSLQGTQAQFGGDAQIYVDRYDGEGVKGHNQYRQQLTAGASQQDDSYLYEGNLSLADSSSLQVSNTEKNPLRFGKFIAIDKQTLALSYTPTHYTLSMDTTSSAKIKFLELHDGVGIQEIITPAKNTPPSQAKTLSVQNLKVFSGKSLVIGNINLSMQSYAPMDANPIAPTITFTNLDSQLHLKNEASLTLSDATLLQIQAQNLQWENLNYNTLYPLIISESAIADNRSQKEVEFIGKALPSFIIPSTINKPQTISVSFSRNIGEEIMQESDWLKKYASIIISSDMTSATIAEIENFQAAINGYENLLSSLLETNLEGRKIFKDIYLDTLIQKACNGNIAPLQGYLGGIEQTLRSSSRYGVSILTTSLYNSTHYSYLKNIQTMMQNQVAFSQPLSLQKKIALAENQLPSSTPYTQTQSDYFTPPLFISQDDGKNNRLWADVHGAFLGGEDKIFYSMGLSGGYDYALITQNDEFLSLGVSLHYSFAQYQETPAQDTSHNIIAGLHTQYTIYANEILLNLYAGGSIANNTNGSVIPEFNTTRADNLALQAESYYKYRFELKKDEQFYHAIKPIVGVGYSYLQVPQEYLGDLISISEVKSNNVFLKAGMEYNLATPQTQNIFSLIATYNTNSAYKREITIGTATPQDYSTEIKPFWLELSYSGSYLLSEDFNLFYTISTQFIPNSSYGISGNIGGSWSF